MRIIRAEVAVVKVVEVEVVGAQELERALETSDHQVGMVVVPVRSWSPAHLAGEEYLIARDPIPQRADCGSQTDDRDRFIMGMGEWLSKYTS